ncbi:hypothetical protein [Colwellia ponticola]|uniref:Uncharacterized protein n=1 Tax=Colwellia ponticola TaxID=2304625 RepID=A0A8H2JMC1_9GAMM|nr:hypothetical protein [Colwellia ponticola]TMM45757.1 hypothetical protein FCS21_08020 [Colwellia ponticola]
MAPCMSLINVKTELINALKNECFFKVVIELYLDERKTEKYLIEALHQLNSESLLNINELFKAIGSNNQHDFWIIFDVYRALLPNLEASVLDVMECILLLKDKGGENLGIGNLITGFTKFCEKDSERCKEAFTFSLHEKEKFIEFMSASLISGSLSDVEWSFEQLKTLIIMDSADVRKQAYFAISRIQFNLNIKAKTVISLLEKKANEETDDLAISSLFHALINLGEKDDTLWIRIAKSLDLILKEPKSEVLYAVSNVAGFDQKYVPNSIKLKFISCLKNVTSKHVAALSNIGRLLRNLLNRNEYVSIEDLLECLINKGICVTEFGYFNSELFKGNKSYLNHLITKWFLSGSSNLCCAVHDLLNDVSIKDIEIKVDVEQINKLNETPIFLARKAVGWLFTRPIIAASFILSIIDTVSTEKREELNQLLFEPLLISYSGELRRYLERIESNSSLAIKNSVQHVVKQLDDYFNGMEGVWGINEILCSQQNREQYWEHSQQLMEEAYEAAQPSALSDLFTQQTILYGNSSAVYIHDGSNQLKRSEMKMTKHSYSTELPRLNTLDPESLDYMLRFFRMEAFKHEVNS